MSVKTTVNITEEFGDVSLRIAKVDGVFESIYLHGSYMSLVRLETSPKKAAAGLRKIADFLETV